MEGRCWRMKTVWLLLATLTVVSAQVNIAGNCDALTCSGGETCRETIVQIFNAVLARCYDNPPGDVDACTPGEPLLEFNWVSEEIEVSDCADGNCPTGYSCNAANGDVCCPDAPKEGSCPSPENLDGNGNCGAIVCNNDHNCFGDDKCCTDSCGGSFCSDLDDGTPGVGVGVGVCPRPHLTWAQLLRLCHKECYYDSACPGSQKCCVDYFQCGSFCQDPEPSRNCGNTICPAGQWCHMVSPTSCTPSIFNPCFASPQCINIGDACGRNCHCELLWNHARRTVEPGCVFPRNPWRGGGSRGD